MFSMVLLYERPGRRSPGNRNYRGGRKGLRGSPKIDSLHATGCHDIILCMVNPDRIRSVRDIAGTTAESAPGAFAESIGAVRKMRRSASAELWRSRTNAQSVWGPEN